MASAFTPSPTPPPPPPAHDPRRARAEFLAGMRAILPNMVGTLPFGMIAGFASVAAGLSESAAYAMTFIVFAGASQIAASQLVSAGAPVAVIVLTVFVINLRFAMYSAYVAPHVRHLSLRHRLLLAFFITDTGFAASVPRFQDNRDGMAHWFMLGTGFALWAGWQVGGIAGIFLGARVPAHWLVDFITPLAFTAMAAPLVREKPMVAAALAAALTAVIAHPLPYKLGLLVAAFTGIAAGMLSERWTRRASG